MSTYRLPINTEVGQLEIEFSIKRSGHSREETAYDAVDKLNILIPEDFMEACRERAAKHVEQLVEETDD